MRWRSSKQDPKAYLTSLVKSLTSKHKLHDYIFLQYIRVYPISSLYFHGLDWECIPFKLILGFIPEPSCSLKHADTWQHAEGQSDQVLCQGCLRRLRHNDLILATWTSYNPLGLKTAHAILPYFHKLHTVINKVWKLIARKCQQNSRNASKKSPGNSSPSFSNTSQVLNNLPMLRVDQFKM